MSPNRILTVKIPIIVSQIYLIGEEFAHLMCGILKLQKRSGVLPSQRILFEILSIAKVDQCSMASDPKDVRERQIAMEEIPLVHGIGKCLKVSFDPVNSFRFERHRLLEFLSRSCCHVFPSIQLGIQSSPKAMNCEACGTPFAFFMITASRAIGSIGLACSTLSTWSQFAWYPFWDFKLKWWNYVEIWPNLMQISQNLMKFNEIQWFGIQKLWFWGERNDFPCQTMHFYDDFGVKNAFFKNLN